MITFVVGVMLYRAWVLKRPATRRVKSSRKYSITMQLTAIAQRAAAADVARVTGKIVWKSLDQTSSQRRRVDLQVQILQNEIYIMIIFANFLWDFVGLCKPTGNCSICNFIFCKSLVKQMWNKAIRMKSLKLFKSWKQSKLSFFVDAKNILFARANSIKLDFSKRFLPFHFVFHVTWLSCHHPRRVTLT